MNSWTYSCCKTTNSNTIAKAQYLWWLLLPDGFSRGYHCSYQLVFVCFFGGGSPFLMGLHTHVYRTNILRNVVYVEIFSLKMYHIFLVSILDFFVAQNIYYSSFWYTWLNLSVNFVTFQTSFSLSGSHTFLVIALHIFFLFWTHDTAHCDNTLVMFIHRILSPNIF